ncbi:MAG: glycosyltransferase [Synergistaceae bacterium]
MKSIAIVYASEGTGHKTAAFALRERFLADYPDAKVICVDVLDFVPFCLKFFVSEGYVFLARYLPFAWGWLYWGSDKESFCSNLFDKVHSLLCKLYLPKLEMMLRLNGAEAVFFTHYFGAAPLALRNLGTFPVFYVNTDFVSHRFQRDKIFKHSFVACDVAVKQYLTDGVSAVSVSGIPISSKFDVLPSKGLARSRLGLSPDDSVVLVSGGGIGAGSVFEVARNLSHSKFKVLVVCGNNAKLFGKLKSACLGCNVMIYGFVSNMEDFYCASDVAVIKPGGLSTSECLATGLPMILTDPIPGQEKLNLDFLCSRRAALELRCPSDVVRVVSDLLGDDERLSSLRGCMRDVACPNASFVVLDVASRLLF